MILYGSQKDKVNIVCFIRVDDSIFFAVIALIVGVIYSGFFSVLFSSLNSISQQTGTLFPVGTAFSGITVVLIQVIATVSGFIGGFLQGLIIAALYNMRQNRFR